MSNSKIVILTYDQAVSVLPDGDMIHTYYSVPNTLLGADWSRNDVLDVIRKGNPQIGGKMCRDSGHGLVVFTGTGPLFIKAMPDLIDELERNMGGDKSA